MKQKELTLIKEMKRAAKDRKGRQEHTTGKVNCSFCLSVLCPRQPSMKIPLLKGNRAGIHTCKLDLLLLASGWPQRPKSAQISVSAAGA